MIRAEHKKWARRIFLPYIDREMRKNFSAFYLLNEFPPVPEGLGLLITPNHMSWWDGFFIDLVCRRYLPKLFHIMMLEEQLERYWFFRFLGAYSIKLNRFKSVIESLEYTGGLVTSGNISVLYPQGVLEPYDKRPLDLKDAGVRYLAEHFPRGYLVLPAAFKISYFEEKHPEVICRFGAPLDPGEIIENSELFTAQFYQNLDMLDEGSYRREYPVDLFS